jgi:hypothetical protein
MQLHVVGRERFVREVDQIIIEGATRSFVLCLTAMAGKCQAHTNGRKASGSIEAQLRCGWRQIYR